MQTTTITSEKAAAVKPKAIPKYRVYTLARQTLNAVERFFALPGVKEDYEKWLVEYKKKEATADLVGFKQNQNGLRNTEEYIQCPFCKDENKSAVVFFDGSAKEYFVYCKACGIETVDVFKTKAAAIKAFTAGKNKKITEGGANNDG